MPAPKAEVPFIDKRGLLAHLRSQFRLEWQGLHGIPHWARVRVNGLMLATENGANPHVVELFAFFHDAMRISEHGDAGHGERGAELAAQLRGRYFEATPAEMDLLQYACVRHSDGMTTGDITVLTCWDADRLDLARVGVTPRALCTDAAKKDANLLKARKRAFAWMNR
jgi:uncharacterized protein